MTCNTAVCVANKVEYGETATAEDILNGKTPKPKGEVFDRMYKALDDVSGAATTAANMPQN